MSTKAILLLAVTQMVDLSRVELREVVDRTRVLG